MTFGMKKPLNMLEGPVYPDIKQGPPRYQWSGKAWNVDVGKTLISQSENIPQFVESAVLVQSRSYNSEHCYGKSSHRDYVNEEFRPPLLRQEDFVPLSRLPRDPVVPRINPGTDGTNTAFLTQNERPSEVFSHLTDRIKDPYWRPSFYCPVDTSLYDSVLPDLESKLPTVAVSSGFNFPSMDDVQPRIERHIDYQKLQTPLDAGLYVPIEVNGCDAREGMSLGYKNAMTSVSAGINAPYTNGTTPIEYDLEYNNPQVSASSNASMPSCGGMTPVDIELEYTNPQVSASSGTSNPYYRDGETRTDYLLDKKLNAPNVVLNYAPDVQANNSSIQKSTVRFQEKYKPRSYQVPAQMLVMRDNATRPAYQEKKKALGSYKGYDNKGFIPRSGLDIPQTNLRKIQPPKQKKYSI